jgi:hypothetical protein
MMRHITQKQALRAAKELATDTVYTRSMSTGWKPTAEARELRPDKLMVSALSTQPKYLITRMAVRMHTLLKHCCCLCCRPVGSSALPRHP